MPLGLGVYSEQQKSVFPSRHTSDLNSIHRALKAFFEIKSRANYKSINSKFSYIIPTL